MESWTLIGSSRSGVADDFLRRCRGSRAQVWGRSVQVFVDRSRRLIPYWDDQSLVCRALRSIYPPEGYSEVVLPEGRFEPSWMKVGGQVVEYKPPPPGSAVVALGDLGVLARGGSRLIALWAERGRRLRDLDVKPLALVPFRRAACPEELSRYWTILPWELSAEADAAALGEEKANEIVATILTLLSFTLRIEPQLVRFVRRLLEDGRGDPGIESLVWQHEALGEPHCEAAKLSREQAGRLRAGLGSQEESLRDAIYHRVEALHRKVYEGVWFAEMANIGADGTFDPADRGRDARLVRGTAWFDGFKDDRRMEPARGVALRGDRANSARRLRGSRGVGGRFTHDLGAGSPSRPECTAARGRRSSYAATSGRTPDRASPARRLPDRWRIASRRQPPCRYPHAPKPHHHWAV